MQRSRTLKRLGVAGLGAATFLSTPWIGAVGTALATPATVQIMSQTTNSGSTQNDGTNTTIKISANTTPPTAPDTDPVTGVRFTYSQTVPPGASNVVIGTDNTAPYSIEWTPPTNATYDLQAEALGAANNVIDTDTKTGVVVNNTAPSVH